MKRDYRLYIDDILEAIGSIEGYVIELTFEEFIRDKRTVDAVIRNFEIIGEGAKHIPEKVRRRYTEVPWKAMAGMRDKLIHEYFGVMLDVVWETIKERLPEVKPLIENVLKEMEDEAEKNSE